MYQVVGWNDNFEVAKTRGFKNKSTCTMPCKHGLGFRLITTEPEGAAIFGAWCAMIQVLSRHKTPRAGYLTSDGTESGRPYTADDLHLLTGIPSKYFSLMLDLCSSQRVGWLSVIESTDTTRIQEGYHEDTTRILHDHLNSNLNSNLNYDSLEASRMTSNPTESDKTSNDTSNEPLSEQDHELEYVSLEECRTEGENVDSMLSPPPGEKTVEPPRQRLASSSGTGNVVLLFPCVGQVKEWQLRESKLSEWNESYSGAVDVLSECRKARQWLMDNPARRKTANGMPRFLGAWISRAVNSNRCRVGAGPMEVA